VQVIPVGEPFFSSTSTVLVLTALTKLTVKCERVPATNIGVGTVCEYKDMAKPNRGSGPPKPPPT
jgi:hypothetical protein